MAKVVGDIAIKVGADTTSLVTGMRAGEMSLAKFGKIAGGTLAAVGVAMVALTKTSMDNIDVLAKQARSLGLSTQAFQKMSMVAGEAGVEAGNLSNMLGKMQRNIDELRQGTATQTEVFNRLGMSIADLQGLSPDEQFARIAKSLDGIKDPAEKTALAMEVFGKSGRDAINMLSGYSAAAENAAEFQNRFGIAVTQTASDGVERANDAVGRLGMVMTGLGNTMAGIVAPAIEGTANAIIAFVGSVAGAKVTLEEFFGTIENARASLGEDVFNALLGDPAKIREYATELEVIVVEMESLGTVAATAAPQFRIFADEIDSLGESAAAEVMRQLAAETDKTRQAFEDGTITAQEFQVQMSEIITRAQGITTEFANINGSDFSTAYTNIQGLASRLWDAARAASAVRANLPGGSGEMTTGTILTGSGEDLIPRSGLAPTSSIRPERPGVDSFPGEGEGGGKGGGGGGGIKDLFAKRLEAIVEGLKTEKEVIDEWYTASLETLNKASDAELAAIGGKQEAIERLEREHQERLAAIKGTAEDGSLRSTLGNAEKLIGIVAGGNKKLMKLQAGLAVANSWLAFTEVLKDPAFVGRPWARAIAAGQALASGLAAARKIGSSGAGGDSGSSSASSAAAQAPQPPTQNFIIDAPGMNIGSLVESLNRAADAGYRIRVNAA